MPPTFEHTDFPLLVRNTWGWEKSQQPWNPGLSESAIPSASPCLHPIARQHRLSEGDASTLHIEVKSTTTGDVVRYVYEVSHPKPDSRVGERRSMAWYFAQGKKKGLGDYSTKPVLPEDAPRGRELW